MNLGEDMGTNIRDLITEWPKCFIKDTDLEMLLGKTDEARYSLVKRALKKGLLIRIKRGLYLIAGKNKKSLPDEFEMALTIYGPSFVSLESALSYHGWIPEIVYTTTCVSTKRAKEFETPIGIFSYRRVPTKKFYTGVERIEINKGVIFVATPWRALADFIYTRRKSWENLSELEADLRIDRETILSSDLKILVLLIESYPSRRVRETLKKISKEILNKS
jgi:hypothetical protein